MTRKYWNNNCSLGFMLLTCFLVIQDFSPGGSNSHLEGGMTYQNGTLTVPTSGRYYIYANLSFHEDGTVIIKVGDRDVSMISPQFDSPIGGKKEIGTMSASGVFKLNAVDFILLMSLNECELYMGSIYPFGSYFVAYMI